MDPEAPKQADEDEFENSNEQDSGSPQLLDDDDSSDRAVAPEPQELSDEVPDEASDQKTSTGLHAIFDGALDPRQVVRAHMQDFRSVIANSLENLEKSCAKVTLCIFIVVDLVLLWPILFSLKVDETISSSWGVVWIPLWILSAIGLLFLVYLVSWGNLEPPAGYGGTWRDPFPLSVRQLELVKWILLLLFQVLLTLRLDDNIDCSWGFVMIPIIIWACMGLVQELYSLHRNLPALGPEKYIMAWPIIARHCLVIMQLAFITSKVEDNVGWSWWRVFVPAWLLYAMELLSSGCCGKKVALVFMPFKDAERRAREDLRVQQIIEMKLLDLQLRLQRATNAVWLSTMISLVIAASILEGADMSTFVIFIPQFVFAGFFLCFACCFFACLSGATSRAKNRIEQTSEEEARTPLL